MDERSEAIRSLSKFREMKKAQTAQRAEALDVFLDRLLRMDER